MKSEELLSEIRSQLGDKIKSVFEKSPRRIFLEILPEDIPAATRVLFQDMGARFQIASGVDTPHDIEILYHWAFDAHNCVITVRTHLDRQNPEIESLSSICIGTEWIEREMWELLGIRFRNHPDMRHLLLKDDWPEGQFPLRRDFHKPETIEDADSHE